MRWKLNASPIILPSLPSFCQKKLSKLIDIWQSSDKNKFAQFSRHSVYVDTVVLFVSAGVNDGSVCQCDVTFISVAVSVMLHMSAGVSDGNTCWHYVTLCHCCMSLYLCYLCWQVSVTGVCVGVGIPQVHESANTTMSLSSRGSFKHSLYWPSVFLMLHFAISMEGNDICNICRVK